MPISGGLKAASFSIVLTAAILFDGCASSSEIGDASSLCFYYYAITRWNLPEFDARIFQTPDTAGQRLDVYLGLRESRLKYEKIGDAYRASYTANVRVFHKDAPERMKEVQRVVWKQSYPSSTDSSYDVFLLSFGVDPGEHSIEITATDGLSGREAVHKYEEIVPDIAGQDVSMSDILLLARMDMSEQGRKITPFVLSNAGLLSDTLKFFTVFRAKKASAYTVLFTVYRLTNRERLPAVLGGMVYSSRGGNFDPCRMGVDTLQVYSHPVSAELDSGFTFVFGGVPKPVRGNYLLKVSLLKGRQVGLSSVLPFRIRGRYFPEVTADKVEMVNSLNYIASERELEEITKFSGDSAIKANLLKFWSEYGGFKKMNEYYHRVSQANRLFSTCVDGWRTPMGMFYVICGPPDYVECRGAYSERWVYTQASTNKFIQVDFKLVRDAENPEERYYGVENVSSNLDFWSYYVSRWRTPY